MNTIIKQLNQSLISREDLFTWRGDCHENIFHVLASEQDISNYKKAKVLLGKDYTLQLLNQVNQLNDYPVHVATWAKSADVIEEMSRDMQNFDIYDENQRNPLMIATKLDDSGLIEKIIHYTFNIDTQDKTGATVLHYAHRFAHPQIFNLLSSYGATTCADHAGFIPCATDICEEEELEHNVLELVNTTKTKLK